MNKFTEVNKNPAVYRSGQMNSTVLITGVTTDLTVGVNRTLSELFH